MKTIVLSNVLMTALLMLASIGNAQTSGNNNSSTSQAKLENFSASVNGSRLDLQWLMTNETNANYFSVEKSADGKNFSNAGIAFGYDNATNSQYAFPDHIDAKQTTEIYYRLSMVDNNGKITYSDTRMVKINKDNNSTISQQIQ